jgi:uncharacterized membrane protein YfcA
VMLARRRPVDSAKRHISARCIGNSSISRSASWNPEPPVTCAAAATLSGLIPRAFRNSPPSLGFSVIDILGDVTTPHLITLVAIFFLTSILSVATGSTSLITVPAMIGLGVEAHVAVETNMMALTFMSIGGSLPFIRHRAIHRSNLPISILLTVVGSGLGALLLMETPVRALQFVVAAFMLVVAVFMISKRDFGLSTMETPVSRSMETAGYVVTFLLAIYGGFFSGGYVTMLTAAFVFFFGMTFLQSMATTKIINVSSSAVATCIFLWRGVVDVELGIILGIAMFFGALLGGRVVLQLSSLWLRRIFVAAVLGLAVKMLLPLWDFTWQH